MMGHVVMLSVTNKQFFLSMLNVIMQSVVMLSVVAPKNDLNN